jgi:hypothetical protein
LNHLTVPSDMYFSCETIVREARACAPGYRDRQPAGKTWPCTCGVRCQKFAGAGTRNEFRLQPPPIKHHAWHPADQPRSRHRPGPGQLSPRRAEHQATRAAGQHPGRPPGGKTVHVPIAVCAALRLPRASAGCPRPWAGAACSPVPRRARQRRAVRRASLAVSEFGQLGARRHDARTARTEIDDQGGVNLDADDPAEAVCVVGDLIPDRELLGRRRRGRGAEGTSGQEAPGRGAGWLHHYQYAPSGSTRGCPAANASRARCRWFWLRSPWMAAAATPARG